ncbi:hypothetical protein I7I53_04606 [Histoplasma capsulatum var. duboisii H88]|uniref:Uncharacterized protein n=1 Tax=Ajellomyces capsulatus (strain H88) TaxID=544711 RepID=A0A8A1LQV2_AJEC8|nr:hypothetical protein I7I53_04606 [Histoplasma capsulatum var. duboisii H88]
MHLYARPNHAHNAALSKGERMQCCVVGEAKRQTEREREFLNLFHKAFTICASTAKFGVPNPVTGSHPTVAFHPALGIYGVDKPEALEKPVHPSE